MKIVVTSDLHVHPFRLCSRDGGRDRLRDGLSILQQSLDLAREVGAHWVFAGDLKQPKWIWPQEALTGSMEVLCRYPDVMKVMIPGNHDGDVTMIGGSGLAPFKGVPRTVVLENPSLVSDILFVPSGHHDRLDRGMVQDARAVVAHAFLSGVALGPDEVRRARDLEPEAFGVGDGRPGFFGDIHKGQMLVYRKARAWVPYASVPGLAGGESAPVKLRAAARWAGEVFYPGSPYMQNWGERNDGAKGALSADLGTGSVEFHPLRAPRYREVTWPNLKFDTIDALVQQAREWEGDFVRILAGDWVERGAARDVVEKIRRTANARFFRVLPIPRDEPAPLAEADLHAGLDPEEMLRRYLAARPCEVDDPQVLAAGLKLYRG